MMLTALIAERELAKGNRVTLLGKDIVSAFNNTEEYTMISTLARYPQTQLNSKYVKDFFRPRKLAIVWDGLPRLVCKQRRVFLSFLMIYRV